MFAASSRSARSLALVRLKGTNDFVVRDISDINHPFTVSRVGGPVDYAAQFVNATELSDRDDTLGLVRMPLSGLPRTVVAPCGGTLFAWSPDGTAMAYVAGGIDSKVSQLHMVSGGRDSVVDTMPSPFQGPVGCESRSCADNWFFRVLYSPNGAYFALVEFPGPGIRIYTPRGALVASVDALSPTMAVFSGSALYWRDDAGVEVWRDGSKSLVLPGVSWIRPHASPAGGQIVYETRDPGYTTAHTFLFDTASGASRELAVSRSEPAFLTARYVWYLGERPCTPTGSCMTPTTPTDVTYIYDLQTSTESQSIISQVLDVWPHPA